MLPPDRQPPPFRIRENADLLDAIRQSAKSISKASDWLSYLDAKYGHDSQNPWVVQLQELMQDWQRETDDAEVSSQQTLEFLYETLAEQRRDRRLGRGVFLGTIHSVKGMEFAHLFMLDGGWTMQSLEEQRRLFYVGMTRAKKPCV